MFILFFGGGMALLLLFQRGLLPPPTPGLAAALPWLVTVLCAAGLRRLLVHRAEDLL